uniref:Uncharacterized protein n=2 Tax=Brassica oleracea TaxID=3712 RepID=A0A0D3C556_BRAOL|nr:unnamed protein product [Brassica oleracea]
MSRKHKRNLLRLQKATDKINLTIHAIAKSEKYILDSAAEYGNKASNLESDLSESDVSWYLQRKEWCLEVAKKYADMRHVSLDQTMCQSLLELSREDLMQADVALYYLKDSGFELDWLEKKLDQVQEKKEKEMSCLAILQETE